jgi:hypothetical protein
MPSPEFYKDTTDRLRGSPNYSANERYDYAAHASCYTDKAPDGSKELDEEVYDFIVEALITIDSDPGLNDADRRRITGVLMGAFAHPNSVYNQNVVWQATLDYSDQKAEDEHRDPTGIRYLGMAANMQVRREESREEPFYSEPGATNPFIEAYFGGDSAVDPYPTLAEFGPLAGHDTLPFNT